MPLETLALSDCTLEDADAFAGVGLYRDLLARLRRDGYRVRRLPDGPGRWDQALLLNLAFWEPGLGGGDVMVDDVVPADVVCHMAWHHLASRHLAPGGEPQAREALALGEAIASAFDLYLVGRLLALAPESSFLETQVPRLLEAWEGSGRDEASFAAMLEGVQRDPEGAFEDLRRLLLDAVLALAAAPDAGAALAVLERLDAHRFGGLLHHYELPAWVLTARAAPPGESGARALEVDAALRSAPSALDWLEARWVRPG